MSNILDSEVLGRFMESMKAANDPLAKHLLRGETQKWLDTIQVEGRPLPVELTRLWSWHNGADPDPENPKTGMFGGFAPFLFAQLANDHYLRRSGRWDDGFFPFAFTNKAVMLADCRGDLNEQSAVSLVYLEPSGDNEVKPRALPSLRSLFELWIEALDRGFWKYDESGWPVAGEPWPDLEPDLVAFVDASNRVIVE